MAYSIERLPERISIGRETETGVTDVMIDCGAWVSKWPGMTLHAIHTPEGGAPYILQTETVGSVLVWHVTDADTAKPGTGRMEIVGEMDGRRKVSATVKVSVAARMSGTVGEPPEAAKPWADRVVEAAERITGMKAQAETLDAGSSATAAWDGEQGLLTIGVPKGKDGKDAVVDTTLTQSGQAADAKATGDAVRKLKDDLASQIVSCGDNLVDPKRIIPDSYLDTSGAVIPNANKWSVTGFIQVEPGEQYSSTANIENAYWYTDDYEKISKVQSTTIVASKHYITDSAPENAKYIRSSIRPGITNYIVTKGIDDPTYAEYHEKLAYQAELWSGDIALLNKKVNENSWVLPELSIGQAMPTSSTRLDTSKLNRVSVTNCVGYSGMKIELPDPYSMFVYYFNDERTNSVKQVGWYASRVIDDYNIASLVFKRSDEANISEDDLLALQTALHKCERINSIKTETYYELDNITDIFATHESDTYKDIMRSVIKEIYIPDTEFIGNLRLCVLRIKPGSYSVRMYDESITMIYAYDAVEQQGAGYQLIELIGSKGRASAYAIINFDAAENGIDITGKISSAFILSDKCYDITKNKAILASLSMKIDRETENVTVSADVVDTGEVDTSVIGLGRNASVPNSDYSRVYISTEIEAYETFNAGTDAKNQKSLTPYIYFGGKKIGTVVLFDESGAFFYDASGRKMRITATEEV